MKTMKTSRFFKGQTRFDFRRMVGKIDDVMPVKVQAVSKVDEEVSSITALAKSLAPVSCCERGS